MHTSIWVLSNSKVRTSETCHFDCHRSPFSGISTVFSQNKRGTQSRGIWQLQQLTRTKVSSAQQVQAAADFDTGRCCCSEKSMTSALDVPPVDLFLSESSSVHPKTSVVSDSECRVGGAVSKA